LTDSIENAELYAPIVKTSAEQRMVYGWAIVSNDEHGPHFDTQGDHVSVDVARRAIHGFIRSGRGDLNHVRKGTGAIVEALVIDDELAEFLLEALQKGERGALIGYKADDEEAWQGAKSGKLRGFSIGGKGRRRPVA
jgi:hypothetical protein